MSGSDNFTQIRKAFPKWGGEADIAEGLIGSDNAASILHYRRYLEGFTADVIARVLKKDIRKYEKLNLFERLDFIGKNASGVVPASVIRACHAIRLSENAASHIDTAKHETAYASRGEELLQNHQRAYRIGEWLLRELGFEPGPPYEAPDIRACHAIRLSGNSASHLDTAKHETAYTSRGEAPFQKHQRAHRFGEWLLRKLGFEPGPPYEAADIHSEARAPAEETVPASPGADAVPSAPDEEIDREPVREIFDFYHGITLNDDQKKALKAIQSFLTDSDQKVFALFGYAGTGKTTLLKGVYEYLISCGRSNTWLLAPTGKAALVLRRKTGFHATTIHKHIYRIVEDKREAKDSGPELEDFRKSIGRLRKLDDGEKNPILILDEASMIGDFQHKSQKDLDQTSITQFGSGCLLADIFQHAEVMDPSFSGKILFVGDEAQLPPVGSRNSPAFDFSYLEKEYGIRASSYQLTEVVRQKSENTLLSFANSLHKAIDHSDFSSLRVPFSDDIVKTNPTGVVRIFDLGWRQQPKKPVAIIAWTNREVFRYNQLIRRRYFGAEDAPLSPKDWLMVYRSVMQNWSLFINGEALQVNTVGSREVHQVDFSTFNPETRKRERFSTSLRFIPVTFKVPPSAASETPETPETSEVTYYLLENFLTQTSPELGFELSRALWHDFKNRYPDLRGNDLKWAKLTDPYLNCLLVKYGYAMTCHKAQGSEWPWVIVVSRNQTEGDSDLFRWYYTAITRASEKVFLVNAPQVTSPRKDAGSEGWELPL